MAKRENIVDVALLEHAVREDLNRRAPRVMAVLRPLRVVIENYPEGQVEEVDVVNNPEDPSAGTRKVPFSRELYIERDDFREDPPKKFFRLAPGREVRLRCAYFITCTGVVKDPATGEVVELRCTYDPGDARRRRAGRPQGEGDAALGVGRARGRRRSAALRSAVQRRRARQARGDFRDDLNPASLEVVPQAKIEPSAAVARAGARVSVRASRLLLRRSRQHAWHARVQSHGDAQGQLGEGRSSGARSQELEWPTRIEKC